MYIRELQAPRASPIEDGIPVFGTWDRAFENTDLLEIKKPYALPMTKWTKNSRIKEWQCFSAQNDVFYLEASFYNLKLYRFTQIIIYDKQNGEKMVFKKIKPGAGRYQSLNLANSSIDGRSNQFYFRIHRWLAADTIRLDINIEATRRRPSLTMHLAFNVSNTEITPMAVSLGLAERRSMYAYKTFAPVRGDIIWGGRHINFKQDTCYGFFCEYKGFFPYITQTASCRATGFNGVRFGFHLADKQTREPNKNNENAFWTDGKLTLLPPARITMPNGPDGVWVIQDVEGMVDLTFTPKEQTKNTVNLVVANAEFISPLGYYNGMLVNQDGEQVRFKNLFGMGEKLYLRV